MDSVRPAGRPARTRLIFNVKMLIVVVILSRPVLLNTVGKLNNAVGFEIRDYRERPASTDYRQSESGAINK
jgi:hypothetical protein